MLLFMLMKLRVIAGVYGGRFLQSPTGNVTHPMGERIKGSLFNIIGGEIKGSVVLDAFAGSGALGIEALSRGAKFVTFIDNDKKAINSIKQNLKTLAIDDSKYDVVHIALSTFIDKNIDKKYDVIITDPPYNNLQFSTVSRLLNILHQNGLMVLSYSGRGELPTANGIVVVDNRSYGDSALAFYRKEIAV